MTALRSPSDRPQIAAMTSSIAWQGGQEEWQEEHVGEREGQSLLVTKRAPRQNTGVETVTKKNAGADSAPTPTV